MFDEECGSFDDKDMLLAQCVDNMANMYIAPSKLFKENLSAIIKKSRKKMDSAT